MLLLIIEFIQSYFQIELPSVFAYFSTRMALAALTSFLVTLLFGKSSSKNSMNGK